MDTPSPRTTPSAFQGSNVKLGGERRDRGAAPLKPHVPRQPQIFFSIHISTGGTAGPLHGPEAWGNWLSCEWLVCREQDNKPSPGMSGEREKRNSGMTFFRGLSRGHEPGDGALDDLARVHVMERMRGWWP